MFILTKVFSEYFLMIQYTIDTKELFLSSATALKVDFFYMNVKSISAII